MQKVLIIDEDKEWVNVVVKGLQRDRYDITIYSSEDLDKVGEDFVKKQSFALILLGSVFSLGGRIRAIHRLKQLSRETPIVILSPYPAEESVEARECLWLGVRGYEKKPYYARGVFEIIETFSSRSTYDL